MSVSLSFGMRNAVNSMGDIQGQIDGANKRLATGRKVNSALDNAGSYFAAQGYQKDARDLGRLLDSMDTNLKVIDKANKAIDGMRKLTESAQALLRQAANLGATDPNRDTLGTQAADLLTQASRLGYDSGFNGYNLLQTDNAAALTTRDVVTNLSTGTSQTKVTLSQTKITFNDAAGLANFAAATNGFLVTNNVGLAQTVNYTAAAADKYSGVNGNTRLTTDIAALDSVLTNLQARSATISTAGNVLQIRQEFTKSWAQTSNAASDYLVLADINEEGANLSALQTKQQLAVQALSLASRSDQAILRLF